MRDLHYIWFNTNTIQTITDNLYSDLTESFPYDASDRLKSVTRNNGNNQSFDWDGVGNRAGSTIYGDSSTYSRDPDSNQLVSVNGANARSFGYDAVGNVNADTRGSLPTRPATTRSTA